MDWSLIFGALIIIAYPYAVWYGLGVVWKLGLWRLGRIERRAAMPEEKVQDAG